MENCTIYSHYLEFDKVVQIIESKLPKAKVELEDAGMQKLLTATIKSGLFGKAKSLKINYRERLYPSYKLDAIECGLTQNLAGMVNWVQSLPAKNEEIKGKFLHKIMSANCEMSFMTEPEMTPEFEVVLREVVSELDAFVFAQPTRLFNKSNGQHFVDKDLNLIMDTAGNSGVSDLVVNINAKYYDAPKENYTEEQISRKEKSEAFLERNNIKINKNLPCVDSSENVKIRSLDDVVDRTYSLLIIAAKGEGLEQEHLDKLVKDKRIHSLSPREKEVYETANLSDQEKAYSTWRYESLYTLLWALGKFDELKYPSDICNVGEVVDHIFKPERDIFEQTVELRSKEEILDELDVTYRMNWACVNAQVKGEEVSGNLNPSVIYERHYTLNWLTTYMNQDWDDVQTNT